MSEWMAHGYCLKWSTEAWADAPPIVQVLASSSLLVFAAYMAIPLGIGGLYYLAHRQTGWLPARLHQLFIGFLLVFMSCSMTHYMAYVVLRSPSYVVQASILAVCAAVSWYTFAIFAPMTPRLLRLLKKSGPVFVEWVREEWPHR